MSEPLLSDDAVEEVCLNDCSEKGCVMDPAHYTTAIGIRDFYEKALRPIPCSERLPEYDEQVLVYIDPMNDFHTGRELPGFWIPAKCIGKTVEHPSWVWHGIGDVQLMQSSEIKYWLPMPPAP